MLTLDGAGWHQKGDRLVMPDNIGLLHLPPYSPELNPAENIWEFLRQNDLSNRVTRHTRPSSMHAATPGTSLWLHPSASDRLPRANMPKRSAHELVGIICSALRGQSLCYP